MHAVHMPLCTLHISHICSQEQDVSAVAVAVDTLDTFWFNLMGTGSYGSLAAPLRAALRHLHDDYFFR